jgi:hypothetical protein
MNKYIKTLFLTLIIFLSYKSSILACGPYFPEYIYDPEQILKDYYPLFNGVGSTDFKNNPILNQNYEVITPMWGPEYLLPIFLVSKDKELSDEIKGVWAKYLNQQYNQSTSSVIDNKSESTETLIRRWFELRSKYSDTKSEQIEPYIKSLTSTYWCEYRQLPPQLTNAIERLTKLESKFNKDQLAQWINYQDGMLNECLNETDINQFFSPLPIKLTESRGWQNFVLSINKIFGIKSENNFLPNEMVEENEYQVAASEYYKENYDKAIDLFKKIYTNKKHVRREEAALSLGWSYIGQANKLYELDLKNESKVAEKNQIKNLKSAQQHYEAIIADSSLSEIKFEANKYLDYVLYRTDPVNRLSRAGNVLLTTSDPTEFIRNLDDYITLWYKYFYNHIANQKDVPEYGQYFKKIRESGDEFSQWLLAWIDPQSITLDQSIGKYNETKSLLWLFVAQRQTTPDHKQWTLINDEIKKISSNSPFYLTSQYYNLKSQLLDSKLKAITGESIKKLISQSEKDKQYSAQNLFKGLMFDMSDDIMEKQKYSVMNYLFSYDNYWDLNAWPPYYENSSYGINHKEALISHEMKKILASLEMNKLNDFLSNENIFTPKIKQYLRLSLFTKSILNDKPEIAQNMAVLLAKNNNEISRDITPFIKSTNTSERNFLANKFILSYPEITDVGNEYFDEFLLYDIPAIKTIDNFRRNWLFEKDSAEFFSYRLEQGSTAPDVLTANKISNTIIDFAISNPTHPAVPESLHQLVDFGHYGPGRDSKRAFQLLHTNYPSSYWTKQTPYWYE